VICATFLYPLDNFLPEILIVFVVCAVHYYKNYRTSNCWGQVGWLGKAEGRDYEVLFSCCTARQAAKYSGQLHLQFLCSLRCILSSEAAHFVACIEIGYDMLHNYISTPHSHLLPISDFLAMHAPHMCTGQVAVIQLRA
jgi:hypothetical protein